ncbi:MAG: MAPEG family protein [Myxococcota bacterium]
MLTLTALYAAGFTALLVGLATRVSLMRLRRVADADIRHAARVHGNAVENVPMFVLLFGIAELNGAGAAVLHGFGVAFAVARVLHAVGYARNPGRSVPRFVGISLTWTLMSALAAYGAWLALSA